MSLSVAAQLVLGCHSQSEGIIHEILSSMLSTEMVFGSRPIFYFPLSDGILEAALLSRHSYLT